MCHTGQLLLWAVSDRVILVAAGWHVLEHRRNRGWNMGLRHPPFPRAPQHTLERFPLSLLAVEGAPAQTWVISRNNTGTLISESSIVTKVPGMRADPTPEQDLHQPEFAQTRDLKQWECIPPRLWDREAASPGGWSPGGG